MEQAQGPEPPRAQHLGRKRGGRWGLTGPAAAESKDRCPCPGTPMEKVEVDHRSSYVGNVDSGGPAEELEAYFNHCREVQRVTILCDKFSGYSKDFAYIEFATESAGQAAVELDERIFRGRVIKVLPKRTNLPGINSTDAGTPRCQGSTLPPQQSPGQAPLQTTRAEQGTWKSLTMVFTMLKE